MAKALTVFCWYLLGSGLLHVATSQEPYNFSRSDYDMKDIVYEIESSENKFSGNDSLDLTAKQNNVRYYYKKHENKEIPIRDDILEHSKTDQHIKSWPSFGDSHLQLPELKMKPSKFNYTYHIFGGSASGIAVSLAVWRKWCRKEQSITNSFTNNQQSSQEDDVAILIPER